MNKIFLFCYRDWAAEIGYYVSEFSLTADKRFYFLCPEKYKENVLSTFAQDVVSNNFVRTIDPKNIKQAIVDNSISNKDLLLFYGWSWIVPKEVVNNYLCICLHPSPLPKYRGGSPIQNQILAGEKKSAVTLFKMTEGIDDGPIFAQTEISLEGSLRDVFSEISKRGAQMTTKLIKKFDAGDLAFEEQNHEEATSFKRRKPEESEVFLTDSAETIYNKVRCLQYPYPQAFIRNAAGEKIFLNSVSLKDRAEEYK